MQVSSKMAAVVEEITAKAAVEEMVKDGGDPNPLSKITTKQMLLVRRLVNTLRQKKHVIGGFIPLLLPSPQDRYRLIDR